VNTSIDLECIEDGSSKFWSGSVKGKTLTTRWGKIGTAGQSKAESFASAADAEQSLTKQAAAKRKKGYMDKVALAGKGKGDRTPTTIKSFSEGVKKIEDLGDGLISFEKTEIHIGNFTMPMPYDKFPEIAKVMGELSEFSEFKKVTTLTLTPLWGGDDVEFPYPVDLISKISGDNNIQKIELLRDEIDLSWIQNTATLFSEINTENFKNLKDITIQGNINGLHLDAPSIETLSLLSSHCTIAEVFKFLSKSNIGGIQKLSVSASRYDSDVDIIKTKSPIAVVLEKLHNLKELEIGTRDVVDWKTILPITVLERLEALTILIDGAYITEKDLLTKREKYIINFAAYLNESFDSGLMLNLRIGLGEEFDSSECDNFKPLTIKDLFKQGQFERLLQRKSVTSISVPYRTVGGFE